MNTCVYISKQECTTDHHYRLALQHINIYIYIYIYMYTYIYIYLCVCVCVCVCNSIIAYVVHYRPPPLQQLPMDFFVFVWKGPPFMWATHAIWAHHLRSQRVKWLIYMCPVSHSHVWHDSFTYLHNSQPHRLPWHVLPQILQHTTLHHTEDHETHCNILQHTTMTCCHEYYHFS